MPKGVSYYSLILNPYQFRMNREVVDGNVEIGNFRVEIFHVIFERDQNRLKLFDLLVHAVAC